MIHSALGHRELDVAGPADPARPVLIALGGRDDAVERLVAPLADAYRVDVLEPPRRAHPRRPGVPSGPGDWLLGESAAPDPLSLGLCLEQLEQFLLARDDRPLLFGAGQGATLALSLALIWPERLGAVIAWGGCLPALPAGALAEQPLAGLIVVRVAEPDARTGGEVELLRARGADARRVDPAPPCPRTLRRWLHAGGGRG